MTCRSLRHAGEELLASAPGREGVPWAAGIPLLHPWANRLGGFRYTFEGVAVTLAPDSPEVQLEEHGLPLHGVRGVHAGWVEVERSERRVVGRRDMSGMASFPFDHRVEVAAELTTTTLTLTTTLTATGDRRVPVTFGYHPFFKLPGVARADWRLTLPVEERFEVDDQLIPTGAREPAGDLDGPLGTRTFDDGFTVGSGPFVLEGGGRRVEVAFERGYPYAQVFAPPNGDVVCFEPMTAPADALRHSPGAVAPGESFSASFSVSVSRAG
jgi:galactose mutarotase-like enzyme